MYQFISHAILVQQHAQPDGVFVSSVTGWVLGAIVTLLAVPFVVWVVTSIFRLENKVELVAYSDKTFAEKLDKIELRMKEGNDQMDGRMNEARKQIEEVNRKLDRVMEHQAKFMGRLLRRMGGFDERDEDDQ